jgi:hypothetical protein
MNKIKTIRERQGDVPFTAIKKAVIGHGYLFFAHGTTAIISISTADKQESDMQGFWIMITIRPHLPGIGAGIMWRCVMSRVTGHI